MKRNASLAVVLLSCLAAVGCGGVLGGSSAACGQGAPTVEPSRAAPGEAFVLSGGGYGGGCDDSNMPFTPDPPQRDILIEMRQGGKAWHLATADAGGPPDYGIETTLEVPEDAEPGGAFVVSNAAEEAGDGDAYVPLKVPFEVLGGGPGTAAGPTETNIEADLAADEDGNLVGPRPPEYQVTEDGTLIIGGDVLVNCAEVGVADGTLDRAAPAVRAGEEEARNEAIRACRNAGFPTAADDSSGTLPDTGGAPSLLSIGLLLMAGGGLVALRVTG